MTQAERRDKTDELIEEFSLEHKFEKIKGIDLSGGGNAAGQKLLGRYF
jgi:ABC-type lipopolysaccharide export system ATPase subunit